MKRHLIFIFFCFLAWKSNAQLLLNQGGEAFTDQPFFNADLIRANHIKSIEGNYATKNNGEMIHESTDWVRYEFDVTGRLIEHIEIRNHSRKKEIQLHQYAYDSLGLILMHRRSENGGFTRAIFDYDSSHQLSAVATYRDNYDYASNTLKATELIQMEFIQHLAHDNVRIQKTLNSDHLPYLEEISSYNQEGYLVQRKALYHMSGIEHHTEFSYDSLGLLVSKAHFNEQDDLADEEWKYRYDAFGNLMEVHYFRYGQFQKDLQVIFDSKTQLLGSTIQRDVASNFMLILRFTKYSYFP